MLRRPKDTHPVFSAQAWMVCGKLFLDTLSYYLNEAPDAGFGPLGTAVGELCTTLSRDLHKLDAASVEDECDERGISQIKSWLWGEEGMCQTLSSASKDKGTVLKLTAMMKFIIDSTQPNDRYSSQLSPSFRGAFHSVILQSSSRSNKTCSGDEVNLLYNTIEFCGADNVFPIIDKGSSEDDAITTISLERFCVNDLIRWVLIHASASPSAIKTDFGILKLCLLSLTSPHQQKQIWEAVLRELIKSFCDFTTLAVGLSTMADGIDVRCDVLDQFGMDTGDSFMSFYRKSHDLMHQDDDVDSVKRKGSLLQFFKTCVGLSNCKSIIVSASVIKHWIEICCKSEIYQFLEEKLILEDESGSNALLETLLQLAVSSDDGVISRDEEVKLVMNSWFEGGTIWKSRVADLMNNIASRVGTIRDEIVSLASSSLYKDIRCTPPTDHAILELVCQSWANRATRLVEISASSGLGSIGLGNAQLWRSASSSGTHSSEFLFLCLMYLLHEVDSTSRRRELLFANDDIALFMQINASIAEIEGVPLQSFHRRTLRNQQLFGILGGHNELTEDLIEECCKMTVDSLALLMKEAPLGDTTPVLHTLTSLSYLVSLMFPSGLFIESDGESKDEVNPADVKEGDMLWYEKGNGERVESTVLKIHTDDFPNLYFTIKDNVAERQTVASRLKKQPKNKKPVTKPPLGEDNIVRRERMGRYVVQHLVIPYIARLQFDKFDAILTNEASAECINIVVSQCGFISVGIGSVRYDIFQTVSSVQSVFCDTISTTEPDLHKLQSVLRCLTLAFGGSGFTVPSAINRSLLKIDVSASLNGLLNLYENLSWVETQTSDPFMPFHLSVATWISVAIGAVDDGDTLTRLSAMLHKLCSILLPCNSEDLAVSSLHTMNAIAAFQTVCRTCMDYSSIDNEDEAQVLVKATESFVDISSDALQPDEDNTSLWMETFTSLLTQNLARSPALLLPATFSCVDGLYDSLFEPTKRWCAFQLLNLPAKDSAPLQAEGDAVIPTAIEMLLPEWKKTMDEEEGIELEDDVLVSSSWLPEKLMVLLQTIGAASSYGKDEYESEEQVMGNILAWMLCLETLDTAGSVDMRNRSSISAFIQNTKAIGRIMISALHNADLDISRNVNIFRCIDVDRESSFILQMVATLAVFRTVESLPTLVKTWFNDDCPRYLQQKLINFVETRVAPETLQRELDRIKDATTFGEMSVNGSCVSREVVATYQQDEVS